MGEGHNTHNARKIKIEYHSHNYNYHCSQTSGEGGGVVVEDGSLITFDPVALDLITLKRAS